MFYSNRLIIARCEDFPTAEDVNELQWNIVSVNDDEKAYEHVFWRTLEDWEYEKLKIIYAREIEKWKSDRKFDENTDDEAILRKFFENHDYRYNDQGELCEKVSGISLWAELQENEKYSDNDLNDEESLERYKFRYGDLFEIYNDDDIYAYILPSGCPVLNDNVSHHNAIVRSGMFKMDTMVYVIE